jgi:hypothetical protein
MSSAALCRRSPRATTRPCAVLYSTPAVRAAQASSALENFVGKVYRGIDCKVSHELYQVGGRPCAVALQYPRVPPQYHGIDCKVSHELYQVGGRPCAVPLQRVLPEPDGSGSTEWYSRVLAARRGGARRWARRSRGSSSRRRPSTSTSRASAAAVGYP